MALFAQIETIAEQLRGLAPIVDRYEAGDPEFPRATAAWLRDAERLMASHKLPEGAELPALRASIAAAADQVRADEGRAYRRRAANVAAASALERAEQLLREQHQRAARRLEHFEEKLIEAVTAAVIIDLVQRPPAKRWEEWLHKVWAELTAHTATRPTTVYIATSLSSPDRLYILDRVLSRLVELELPVLRR
ncbi:MAG: hypothetical protein KC468_37525 [Myxococcales bacterium]|nr:hypothetical protein [Myxococcales bacterium]